MTDIAIPDDFWSVPEIAPVELQAVFNQAWEIVSYGPKTPADNAFPISQDTFDKIVNGKIDPNSLFPVLVNGSVTLDRTHDWEFSPYGEFDELDFMPNRYAPIVIRIMTENFDINRVKITATISPSLVYRDLDMRFIIRNPFNDAYEEIKTTLNDLLDGVEEQFTWGSGGDISVLGQRYYGISYVREKSSFFDDIIAAQQSDLIEISKSDENKRLDIVYNRARSEMTFTLLGGGGPRYDVSDKVLKFFVTPAGNPFDLLEMISVDHIRLRTGETITCGVGDFPTEIVISTRPVYTSMNFVEGTDDTRDSII